MGVNGFDKVDVEFYCLFLCGIMNDVVVLQVMVQQFIDWFWEEMLLIECGVLLFGVYEFKYYLEMLYCVVFNEVIELVKEYGGIDGYKFVNGVFDKLVFELCLYEVKVKQLI